MYRKVLEPEHTGQRPWLLRTLSTVQVRAVNVHLLAGLQIDYRQSFQTGRRVQVCQSSQGNPAQGEYSRPHET